MRIVRIDEYVRAHETTYTIVYTSEKVNRRTYRRKSLTDREFEFYMNSTSVTRFSNTHTGTVRYTYR